MKKDLVLAAALIAVTLGCGMLPSAKLESEAAAANPNPVIEDADLFLNREPMGRISDIGRRPKSLTESQPLTLDVRLSEIIKRRSDNYVFLEGTNEIAANVYLIPDPNVSVGGVARVFEAIDSSAGSPLIPRLPLQEGGSEPVKPNPLFLAVTMGRPDQVVELPGFLPPSDRDHRFTHNVTFEPAGAPDQLRLIRQEGSLEISADERYYVNGKSDSGAPVAQRNLDESVLRAEAEKLRDRIGGVPVIVSDRASYAALLRLLDAVKPATPIRVIVRPTTLPG